MTRSIRALVASAFAGALASLFLSFAATAEMTRPVTVARAIEIPTCHVFVDAAATDAGDGTRARPFRTISAAIDAAAPAAVICVAEGVYADELRPGSKPFMLAGGFERGSGFDVRDSALHVSRAQGRGGSFIRIEDPAPAGDQLVAIDGFEITGYSQAVVRDNWESQRFDLTNNHIHDNRCADLSLAGAGFSLVNVSGTISGNVFRANTCGRGGAGFLNDPANENRVTIEGNLFDGNAGAEPDNAHGGGLYIFGNTLEITGNHFTDNRVTRWGGGLYVGAYTAGSQPTTAHLSNNVFRKNRAGHSGGGFFCDDGATCIATRETYDGNCGGNILLDGGPEGSGPTITRFDHITNFGARDTDCRRPGIGVLIGNHEAVAPDAHTFSHAVFWGNAEQSDFAAACAARCNSLQVSVEHSLVDTAYQDGSVTIAFGRGNIAPVDPLFVAPDAGDLRLRAGSPAVGMGAAGMVAVAQAGGVTPSETTQSDAAPAISAGPGATAGNHLAPAIARGATYMGFSEAFNRYYTDRSWKPARVIYVNSDGGGDGTTRETPMAVQEAISTARPGTLFHFLTGDYQGHIELTADNGGTYDAPVVLYGERNGDGRPGVRIDCAVGDRQACINLEFAHYVAIDGLEVVGGRYGIRSVGRSYRSSEHAKGIAVLNSIAHDQDFDPFFFAQSDWAVWEGNTAFGAGKGDGHGLYISNGSDWNIVRRNETYANATSDFQVNASPTETCEAEGIALNDPECDAYAGEGEGGRGASDYFLVEDNYFHHGDGPGANFTSVRRSLIRNNIFGPQARHNVSFWQETGNPNLGSRENTVLHNLFITTGQHGVQFINGSTRNVFANNLLIGIGIDGSAVTPNPDALLMDVDDTVGENVYHGNVYISGRIVGRAPNGNEMVLAEFSPAWFRQFPVTSAGEPVGFAPAARSPFLGAGLFVSDAPVDRNGIGRRGRADPGPYQAP